MHATDLFAYVYLKKVREESFGLDFLELGQYQVRLSSVTKTQLMACESYSGEPKPSLFWLVYIPSGGQAGDTSCGR